MTATLNGEQGFKNIKFQIEDDKVCNVGKEEAAEDENSILDQSELESESGFETSWSWSRRASTLPRPVSLKRVRHCIVLARVQSLWVV